jgi:sec-independent protein translocase protein TatB
MLSIPHMIVIFVVVLVVFGPQKLPELARGLGKLMAEFRKASTDFKSAFEEEMREMERQARVNELKKQAAAEVAAAEAAAGNALQDLPAGAPSVTCETDPDTKLVAEPVISPAADAVARTGETAKQEDSETTQPIDSIHDKQQPA